MAFGPSLIAFFFANEVSDGSRSYDPIHDGPQDSTCCTYFNGIHAYVYIHLKYSTVGP